MSAEIDVYQDCPCGSGKKLKFCCQSILGDMQRAQGLKRNNQFPQALQLLEGLEKKVAGPASSWSRAWVNIERSRLLEAAGNFEESERLIDQVLNEIPEHPEALAIGAAMMLSRQGVDAARPRLEFALLYATPAQFRLLGSIIDNAAHSYLMTGRPFAARQHLFLAAQLKSLVDQNSDNFKALLQFDGEPTIPFPLRGDYTLRGAAAETVVETSAEPTVDDAHRLAQTGCWSTAATGFRAEAEKQPQKPDDWYNAGLCYAWSGDTTQAAEMLRAAAARDTDFESAVDNLVLAQLLSRGAGPKIQLLSQTYTVTGISRLLTVLDQQPRFSRIELPEESAADGRARAAAAYRILDRDASADPSSLTVDTVPYDVGDLNLFEADPDSNQPARAIVTALDNENGAAARRLFLDTVASLGVEPQGEPEELFPVPAEVYALSTNWVLPEGLPAPRLRQLEKLLWQHVVNDKWPAIPQTALGGKSPQQAAGIPELQRELAATTVVLEANLAVHGRQLDPDILRSRLNLPATQTFDLSESAPIDPLSILQIRRLEFSQLSDQQLKHAVEVLMMLHYQRVLERGLVELLGRPGLLTPEETSRLNMMLTALVRNDGRREEAMAWLQKGRQAAIANKEPLQNMLLWDMQEFSLRADDLSDPQVSVIANRMWTYYVPKLPQLRDSIAGMLTEYKVPGPWNAPAAAGTEPGAVSSGGIWTPTAAAASPGPSKLWIPGQD